MCTNPTKAELQEFGRPKFTSEGSLLLPCGKCTECLSFRAVEWATRARHEISLHNENSFLTLTYNDDKLPSYLVLKRPFQLFMKKLRIKLKRPIRYMVSHEYGSNTFRPHHHAIIFGWNPSEQYEPRTTKSGEKIFRSKELENLWTDGFSSVGTANERSAYYIASYALKGKKHEILLPNGEYTTVSDQFNCSSRPAIGLDYFLKNQTYIVNSATPLPKYYKKLLKEKYSIPEQITELQKIKPQNSTHQQKIIKELTKLNNRLNTLKLINEDLLELHENNLQHKDRSHYEIYAKYKISKSKDSSLNNEFRSTPEDTKEDLYLEYLLKQYRDEEHLINKGK